MHLPAFSPRRLAGVAAIACAAALAPAAALAAAASPAAGAATARPVTAYVASFAGVTPINTITNTAFKAITVGSFPSAIVITPNGKPPTSPIRTRTR